MGSGGYSARWFESRESAALSSARVLGSMVFEDFLRGGEGSLVDVGCGQGEWLSVMAGLGVRDFVGIDGPHVDVGALRIPRDRFVAMDLGSAGLSGGAVGRGFDVALSLEVGEHLAEERAAGFVRFVCALAPVVVFSAAIPGQGGRGHVNERWPGYWARLFDGEGYGWVDWYRFRLWEAEGISSWYAQNTLVYVRRSWAVGGVWCERLAERGRWPMGLVHPTLFGRVVARAERRRLGARLGRLFGRGRG